MNPDHEVAFKAKPAQPVPERGLLSAAGFNRQILLAAGPAGGSVGTHILDSMTAVKLWPGLFWAGPVLGAPMAVMALEELGRRGAREILFLGLAGSLDPELPPGTLISPESGLSTEGTSVHYPAPSRPDEALRARVLAADNGIVGGTIWSTDGIHRETMGLVDKQRRAGAVFVDMETTALWAAARFRGLALAVLLVVSDVLDGPDHHTGFHRPEYKAALARASEIAFKVMGFEKGEGRA